MGCQQLGYKFEVGDTIKFEIDCFFENNPGIWDTSQGISIRIGRQQKLVETVLEKMVSVRHIEKKGSGAKAIYYRSFV